NGHPFFIGDCGHPMEQVICVTDGCGEVVGSLTHSQKDTGLQMKDILQGYKQNNKKKQKIALYAYITCTLLRFLIHLPLLLRDFGTAGGCVHLQKLLNKGSKQEVTDFLWKQAKGNFNLLCQVSRLNEEQLAIALHFFLENFGEWFNNKYPKGLSNVENAKEIYTLEMNMDDEYKTFFGDKKKWNEIRNANKNVENEKEKKLQSEIQEKK
ncbi:hypothetical protein RFI_40096, partial [Reticulomyxa filosa]